MHAKHIQRIVVAQHALEFDRGEEATHPSGQAHRDGPHGADGAGGRGDRHQARHRPRGDAQGAGLAVAQPLAEHPGQGRAGRGDLRNRQGHAGDAVGGQLAASVKAKPADPEHAGADQRVGDIVRHHGTARIAFALAYDQGRRQARHAGVDMHHSAAGEIQDALVAQPAAAPNPVAHGGIDQDQPRRHEPQHGGEFHALGEGAHDEGGRDNGESHLKGHKDALWYGPAQGVHRETLEEGLPQRPPVGAVASEGKAVAERHPQHGHQRGDGETLHHHGEDILAPDHARVKQGQPRNGHKQHQGRGGQHPGGVARAQLVSPRPPGGQRQQRRRAGLSAMFHQQAT